MLLKPTYTIDALISRCKTGERKAQELLYKLFAAKMLGVCMRYATDRMEAEDMLQTGLYAKYYFNDMFENSPAQAGLKNFAVGLTFGF